jgi:uncharacterized LabA/DUF88 family protein
LKKDVKIRVRSVPLLKGFDTSVAGAPPTTHRYSKGEDILLASELVYGCCMNHFDCAVVLTGDADLIPAIRLVQDLGKPITVAAFHGSLSHQLEMEASDIMYLDEFLDSIRL